MRTEMPLEEAISIADRYKRTNEGIYADAFNVLADAVVSYSQRLEDVKKRLDEANDKISALQLDLGIKNQAPKSTLSNILNLGSRRTDQGPGTKRRDASVGVSGVGGKGGVF
jgi:hypothetical protein